MRYTACLMAYLPMWVAAITLRCIRLRWGPSYMLYAIRMPHTYRYNQPNEWCRVLWQSLVVFDSRGQHGGEPPNYITYFANYTLLLMLSLTATTTIHLSQLPPGNCAPIAGLLSPHLPTATTACMFVPSLHCSSRDCHILTPTGMIYIAPAYLIT